MNTDLCGATARGGVDEPLHAKKHEFATVAHARSLIES